MELAETGAGAQRPHKSFSGRQKATTQVTFGTRPRPRTVNTNTPHRGKWRGWRQAQQRLRSGGGGGGKPHVGRWAVANHMWVAGLTYADVDHLDALLEALARGHRLLELVEVANHHVDGRDPKVIQALDVLRVAAVGEDACWGWLWSGIKGDERRYSLGLWAGEGRQGGARLAAANCRSQQEKASSDTAVQIEGGWGVGGGSPPCTAGCSVLTRPPCRRHAPHRRNGGMRPVVSAQAMEEATGAMQVHRAMEGGGSHRDSGGAPRKAGGCCLPSISGHFVTSATSFTSSPPCTKSPDSPAESPTNTPR